MLLNRIKKHLTFGIKIREIKNPRRTTFIIDHTNENNNSKFNVSLECHLEIFGICKLLKE